MIAQVCERNVMLGTNPKELQHNRDNLEGQGCISMKLRKAARQTLKDFFTLIPHRRHTSEKRSMKA